MMCNAVPSCPYCIDAQCGIGEGEWNASAWLKGLLEIGDRYGQMHVGSSSAEPVANSKIASFLNILSEHHYVSTSTNLLAPAGTFTWLFGGNSMLDFSLSYHPHLWSGQSEFADKAAALREGGVKISGITIVGWPPHLPFIDSWIEWFSTDPRTAGILINTAVFNGYYNGVHYPTSFTPEEREIVCPQDKDSEGFRFPGEGKLAGRLCKAGWKALHVSEGGDVTACYMKPKERLLGNIEHGDVVLLDGPSPCENVWCSCENMWTLLEPIPAVDGGS